MKTSRTFTFHTDPGHGWLQVSVSLIKDLGVTDISTCSYVDGAAGLIAFLEEDCDAELLINAYRLAFPNTELKFIEVHEDNDHWIRALPCYHEDNLSKVIQFKERTA